MYTWQGFFIPKFLQTEVLKYHSEETYINNT
jgi:hypothetical protein